MFRGDIEYETLLKRIFRLGFIKMNQIIVYLVERPPVILIFFASTRFWSNYKI